MRSNLRTLGPSSPQTSRTGQAHTLAHPSTPWAVNPNHKPSCHGKSASAWRRRMCAASKAKQGEAGSSSNMLDTIVDELRQYKSETERQQDGGQLLHALGQLDVDHFGATVATGWEGSAAWLDVEGRVQDGEMARRMAMLTVNQERVFRRSQQLMHLVSMMAKQRPGVLPPEAVLRVQNQRNKAFSSLEVLAIQHLIQISVAVLPLASVHHLLTDAIPVALAQLKHLAVLRLHHAGNITKAGIAYQKLQDQRNAVQAPEPASRSLWRPSPPSPSKPSGTTPMPHSKAEEIYLLGQIEMMKMATSTWPGCGRVGWVSFGRGQCVERTSRASTADAHSSNTNRSPSSSTDSSCKSARIGSSSGTGEGSPFIIAEDHSSQHLGGAWMAGGLCAGALERAEGARGDASFGAGQGDEFRAAHALLRQAQATPASPRQLPEASRKLEAVLRANLINAIGRWADEHADAFPALAPLPDACVHNTRLRSAGDNVRTGENVARRFTIMASGKALPNLRKQAREQGQWLLQHLYPISNSTSLVIPDWEYNTEVFFTALLELLSAATAMAARAPAPDAQLQQGRQQPPAWLSSSRPGPWVGTPRLQWWGELGVVLNSSRSSSSSSSSSGSHKMEM
ncbi:hypothetical protein DUNSADRAFT_10211 [Dunaliella salina]|uniref:Uncharacterized protein n=1 Tax=Dunaliella salina TaxID=3046 RepID=A0ABQ7GFY0_DUNSA|nr:hypothetical protein DUNSADRAFT_10211 [Dunaliella salina]|eukprot:KAF5833491.1 hypothetical protein DUNSADRAFT_10211 [Dunaliella salina]